MKRHSATVPIDTIESLIRTVRGQKVILDADLARIYGVETKTFNRAFKRNADRFPSDFVFQLRSREMVNLRYQFGTSSSGYGGRRYLPYAFTENGAIMSANILNSPRAVRMSVFVVRAFVKMREMLGANRELADQLKELERKLTSRLDIHETAIVDVLRRIMRLLEPPPESQSSESSRKEIGFHIKEDSVPYRIRTKPRRPGHENNFAR